MSDAPLRIGRMPYLNVAPFFHCWSGGSVEFVREPPRRLGELARDGLIDGAPLPVFDCFLLEETFEPLGDFAIAADGRVQSVILFSPDPIERLGGSSIAVTGESSTSVRLLKLLLEGRYGLEGIRYDETGGGDGPCLLIGDGALKELHGGCPWRHRYDLATLWTEWTNLPFTFARWVVRKTVPRAVKSALSESLGRNLDEAMENVDALAASHAPAVALPPAVIVDYLRHFTYRIGARERTGLALFREKLEKAGLLNRRACGRGGAP